MAQVLVRNLDDEVITRLKQRATQHHRSLEGELRAILEGAVQPSDSQPNEAVSEALDRVLQTGVPVELERQGKRLRISPVESVSKLDRLVRRPDVIVGDPEDLVHIDWSSEWKP